MPAEHIKYDDVLRDGTDKLNTAIDQANKAELDSSEAKTVSTNAKAISDEAKNIADEANSKSTSAETTANSALTKSQTAISTADDAKGISEQANLRVDNIIYQNGSDNTEVVDGRLGSDGKVHPTLGGHVRALGAQLAQIESKLNANILDYSQFATDVIFNGESKLDWSPALNRAILDGFTDIEFPDGEFLFAGSITLINSVKLIGSHLTTLFFITPNETFFNQAVYTLSISNVIFENLIIKGLSKETLEYTDNQTAFDVRVYKTTFNNCNILGFHTAFLIRGVYVNFIDCDITSNQKGMSVRRISQPDNSTLTSTCFLIQNTNFQYNKLVGLTTNEDEGLTVIKLIVDNCGFEFNGKGFDFGSMSESSVKNSWLESNTNNSTTIGYGVSLENLRLEGEEIDYTERTGMPWGYGGHTKIRSDGDVSFKKIGLQTYYNSTRVPTEEIYMEAGRDSNNTTVVKVNENIMPTMGMGRLNKIYFININGDGTVANHNLPTENFVASKLATGKYKFSIRESAGSWKGDFGLRPVVNVQVMPATHSTTTFMHHEMNVAYIDATTYNSNWRIDELYINCYNQANELTDGKIMITILTDKITM